MSNTDAAGRSPAGSKRPRLAILISGRGSNMLAIARACLDGRLAADVVLVASNRPDARGLEAAETLGIPTAVEDHEKHESRLEFDASLDRLLASVDPDWIVLAGFMRILGDEFVARWQGKIVNIHPSLLPKYPGLDTHARAIAAGDREAGASVHLVTEALDSGPVIGQVRVPILETDTPETLAARVLEKEHELYIRCLSELFGAPGSRTTET